MAALHFFLVSLLLFSPCLAHKPSPSSASASSKHNAKPSPSSSSISSDSVLVALLDSPYTELAEIADEASLLQTLERMVGTLSITILAPRNSFLDRNLDSDFRSFLLEPGNVESLQALLRYHVIPQKISAAQWSNRTYQALSSDRLHFSSSWVGLKVDLSNVIAPDAIVRRDGIVHGIDRLLIPKSVQKVYNEWKEGKAMARILAAVEPKGAPTPKTYLAEKEAKAKAKLKSSKGANPPPTESIFYALAPGPALAPAPAPGPSSGHRWFDGESAIADFISTLVHYGGYSEMADLLVNLTSLAPELAKLVSEGYRITILAPNDEAMSTLTTEDLAASGALEHIIFYHIIPEYQTEESFYNAVRRFGKVSYQTLRDPYKLTAQEEDGTVVFGEGKGKAHLIDIDIFKDGRISVQGLDKVLSPDDGSQIKASRKLVGEEEEEEEAAFEGEDEAMAEPMAYKGNQGWVGFILCSLLGSFHSACQ